MISSVRPACSETSSSVSPDEGLPTGGGLPRRRGMTNLAAHRFSATSAPCEVDASESTASSDALRPTWGASRPRSSLRLPPLPTSPTQASGTGFRRVRPRFRQPELPSEQISERVLQRGHAFLESLASRQGVVLHVHDEEPSVLQGAGAPNEGDTAASGASGAMLAREIFGEQTHRGAEMVEAEMRRVVAESSYARLRRDVKQTDPSPQVLASLRAWLMAAPDTSARTLALRVLQKRIDPRDAQSQPLEQLVYQPMSQLCEAVGLRDLAALVWSAIDQAPVGSSQREALRTLLLYNLADCTKGEAFYCLNGTFQRLMAPLDGVYPGVQTLTRTPYEIVQQVALSWREAIANGERTDVAEDWQAFENACKAKAQSYLAPGMPLYATLQRQFHEAVAVCRSTLQEEIA